MHEQALDFPDAILLHIGVLKRTDTPASKRAVLCFLRKEPPATARSLPVRRDVNDRLQLHAIV